MVFMTTALLFLKMKKTYDATFSKIRNASTAPLYLKQLILKWKVAAFPINFHNELQKQEKVLQVMEFYRSPTSHFRT